MGTATESQIPPPAPIPSHGGGRLRAGLQAVWVVIAASFRAFVDDEPFRFAAALSYYTLLSLAPFFLVVIAVAGLFFNDATVREGLLAQVREAVGPEGAAVAERVISNTQDPKRSILSLVVGGVVMLFGATTVFSQLQAGLNHVWNVEAMPSNAIVGFLRHRLLSFILVLIIGFLLLVSLVVNAVLTAMEGYLGQVEIASLAVWQTLNTVVSFGLVTVLVAMTFKYLPDAIVHWRDLWLGSVITAVLFVTGKHVIGLYLGHAGVGSIFGAAGSVVVLMVWVYYASLIFFFGAEVTQAVVQRRGEEVKPGPHGRTVGAGP